MNDPKKNIFMMIREVKVGVAKKIFRSYGNPYKKMANILTANELVEAFDFFASAAGFGDGEFAEAAMLMDYGEACIEKELLSPESITRIKNDVQDNFFGPED